MVGIMLGDLSAKDLCKRLGIEYTEEIAEMEQYREHTCDKVKGNNVWHCYDIPLFIDAGTKEMGEKWYKILSPVSKDMKDQIRLGGWK